MKNLLAHRTAVALLALALVSAVLVSAGCATVLLPQTDLEMPGWTVRQGQALWKAKADAPRIAGDILVARHENGDMLISFSKGPVPVFTARTVGDAWQLDLVVDGGKSYARRGSPPARRFVWFEVPSLVAGANNATPAPPWEVKTTADGEWTLNNPKTGESIRLFLDP